MNDSQLAQNSSLLWIGYALLLIAIMPGIPILQRWRRGEPLWSMQSLWQMLEQSSFVIGIGIVVFSKEIGAYFGIGIGVSSFLGFLLMFGGMGLASLFGVYGRKSLQAAGIDNPLATGAPPPKRINSAEMKRLNWRIPLAMFAFLGMWVIGFGIAAGSLSLAPKSMTVTILWIGFMIVWFGAVPLYIAKGRWPYPVSIDANVEIAASPEAVWDKISYRETDGHWRATVRKVERLAGPGESYRLWQRDFASCGTCWLPKDPDALRAWIQVDVIEAVPFSRYVYRTVIGQIDGAMGTMYGSENETVTLSSIAEGDTRLTFQNRIEGAKIWAAIFLKLGNSSREFAMAIKAAAEGSADSSLYMQGPQMLAELRAKPKFCGCAVA